MLASVSRLRSVRLIQSSKLRYLVSHKITTDASSQDSESGKANKRAISNEELLKRITRERMKIDSRVLTIPNVLTFSRMVATPFVGYYVWNGMYHQALACFAFAAITDLLDGLIARTFNQQSNIGAIIDPIADKLLISTCIISMFHVNLVPWWMLRGVVYRDVIILVAGAVIRYYGFNEKPTLKKYLDLKNYPTLGMQPTLTSKCNTALLCLLIPVQLATTHMIGIPYYDMSIIAAQGLIVTTSIMSISQYMFRVSKKMPHTFKPPSNI